MSIITQKIIDTVTLAYIEAAFFTDSGPDHEVPSDADLGEDQRALASDRCLDFLKQCERAGLLEQYLETFRTWDSFGHDIWFSSNHHGVGFWDRDMGALGDNLHELCTKTMNESGLYLGDDNRAYFF